MRAPVRQISFPSSVDGVVREGKQLSTLVEIRNKKKKGRGYDREALYTSDSRSERRKRRRRRKYFPPPLITSSEIAEAGG